MEKERLQKYISRCGAMSRRKAEEAISAGRVEVNGRPAKIGDIVVPGDNVTLDKKKIAPAEKMLYLMLNKPRGYVTALSDDRGRKTVLDLLKGLDGRVYPVGRLDFNSEGLLLLTNDGELSYRLTHPRFEIEKAYRVLVSGKVDEQDLYDLKAPVEIGGRAVRAVSVTVLERKEKTTALEIVIREGRNREIRRICEQSGLLIRRLKRVRMGNLGLGELRPGSYRMLSPDEVRGLKILTGLERERTL